MYALLIIWMFNLDNIAPWINYNVIIFQRYRKKRRLLEYVLEINTI